jgi:hypothetical protein
MSLGGIVKMTNSTVKFEALFGRLQAYRLNDIFSEIELASYWVGVSLSDCAESLDKIIKK